MTPDPRDVYPSDEPGAPHVYDESPTGPRLLRSVVAYIDVLGVREMMRSELRVESKGENLAHLHSAYSTCLSNLRTQLQCGYTWGGVIKAFTDNILIAYPVTRHMDEEQVLGGVMVATAHFQMDMALRGYFVRGAIDIGSAYLGQDIAFGAAVVSTYNLEVGEARDPRIILSDRALAAARTHTATYSSFVETPQYALTLLDADGFAFVNYLAVPLFEVDDPPHLPWLMTHKKHVQSNLIQYRHLPYVWSKYRWVAAYHNFTQEVHCLPVGVRISNALELRPSPLTPADSSA